MRCALVAENTSKGFCNALLHKASGVVPGVGARARPSQEENELELLKCAKIAGAAATDGSTADTIELLDVHESEFSKSAKIAGAAATDGSTADTIDLLEVHESEFSAVGRTGEKGIIGLLDVPESDFSKNLAESTATEVFARPCHNSRFPCGVTRLSSNSSVISCMCPIP